MFAIPSTNHSAQESLDEQFVQVIQGIEKRMKLLDRLPKVRIKAWLTKLKETTSNPTWKRNRNQYARLLLEQLRAGCLEVPFNGMPPDGGLPTLPAYLTYRFMSPPRRTSPDYLACKQQASRPSSPDGYSRWTVQCSSAARQLPWPNISPAGVPLAQLPAWSPVRSGSPPRQGFLPGQQEQQDHALQQQLLQWAANRTSPRASPHRRRHQPASGDQCTRLACTAAGLPCEALPALMGNQDMLCMRRPGSPAAAGLLDAAVALAAEVESGQSNAAVLDSRLRFAEEKLLAQEAELVHLQGQAKAVRRRIKAATAASLGDLVDRYSRAAAAWSCPGQAKAGIASSSSSRQAGYAEAVYGPVWQLLSGIQTVLDECDEQDAAQAKLTANAAARYDAPVRGADQREVNATGPEEETIAAAAVKTLLKIKKLLKDLAHESRDLSAALQDSKQSATAAAGGHGRGVAAVDVAGAAAQLLQPMLKTLKKAGKAKAKLQERLAAAVKAVADTFNYSSSSSSSMAGSSSGSDSDDSDPCSTSKHARRDKRKARDQRQALLQCLRAVIGLLQDLDAQGSRFTAQLQDGQTRLQDIGTPASGSGMLLPRDEGLAAAATAGLAAALSAAASSYAARITELRQRLKAINKAPVSAGAGGSGWAADPEPAGSNGRWTASHHLSTAASDVALAGSVARSAGAAAARSSTLGTLGTSGSSALDMLGADGVLMGRSAKTPLSAPSMLAGTAAPAAASSRVNSGSPAGHTPFANLGRGTSLSKAAFTSTLAGLQLPGTEVGVPTAAAATAAMPKPSLLLSPRAAPGAPGVALTSPLSADAGAVHQRLADLSRQASKISERASVLLSSNVSGRSSPAEAAVTVGPAGFTRTGLLTRSFSTTSSTASRPGSPSGAVPALAGSFIKPTAGLLAFSGSAAHASSKASGLLGTTSIGSSSSLLNRPASTSPRLLSGLALLDRNGSSSGAVTGTGGIAAVSSKLSSLSQKWGTTAASSSLLKPAPAWPM